MSSSSSRIGHGLRAALPIAASILPFGLLFGALAVDNGITAFEATLMSLLMYAGASQMVGIELFGADIAPWVVVMSIVVVNIRHLLYSAALGKTIAGYSGGQKAIAFFLMTDPQFAVTEQHAERGHRADFVWYLAVALPCYVIWVASSAIGAVFGSLIDDPRAFGIDFLLPLYFLGLVMAFRARANWLPVVLASGVVAALAFHFVGSPWHVSFGAVAGVLVAAALGPRRGDDADPAGGTSEPSGEGSMAGR